MAFDIKNLDVSADEYYSGLQNLNGGSSSDLSGSGIASALSSAFSALQGFTMMNEGLDLIKDGANYQAGVYRASGKAAIQGSQFQAAVFRQAGAAATVLTNYNIALDEQATARQEGALGRQLDEVVSTNFASMGSSGISINSKSSMAVQNEVMNTAERRFVQIRNDAMQRQSLMTYQGQLTTMQYENQARAAEYSGKVQAQAAENAARNAIYSGDVESYKAESAQADSIGKTVGSLFSAFGGL